MNSYKSYTIKTFDDLCNLVNAENVECLSEDLKKWLITYHLAIVACRKMYPEIAKGKTNTEIATGHFIWHDDGKNDLLGISFVKKEKPKE